MNASTTTTDFAWGLTKNSSSCPKPLIYDPSASTGSSCISDCLTPFFTPEEYDDLWVYQVVWAVLSMAISSFTLVSWWLVKMRTEKLRQTRPGAKYSVLLLLMCSNFMALPFVVQIMNGRRDSLCDNQTKAKSQGEGGFCLYQSLSICYFAMACACWWFCMVIDVFYALLFPSASHKEARKGYWKRYAAFCFSFPLLSTTVIAANGGFGFAAPIQYCFIANDDEWYAWTFFYVPLTLMFVVGFPAIIWTLFHVRAALRGVRLDRAVERGLLMVPLKFILLYTPVILGVLIMRLQDTVGHDSYERSAKEWYECLMVNFDAGVVDPAANCTATNNSMITSGRPECGCGSVVPHHIPLGFIYLITTVTSGQAVLVSITFGFFGAFQSCGRNLWRYAFRKDGRSDSGDRLGVFRPSDASDFSDLSTPLTAN